MLKSENEDDQNRMALSGLCVYTIPGHSTTPSISSPPVIGPSPNISPPSAVAQVAVSSLQDTSMVTTCERSTPSRTCQASSAMSGRKPTRNKLPLRLPSSLPSPPPPSRHNLQPRQRGMQPECSRPHPLSMLPPRPHPLTPPLLSQSQFLAPNLQTPPLRPHLLAPLSQWSTDRKCQASNGSKPLPLPTRLVASLRPLPERLVLHPLPSMCHCGRRNPQRLFP